MLQYLTLETTSNKWSEVGKEILDKPIDHFSGLRSLGVYVPQIGMSVNSILVLNRASSVSKLHASAKSLSNIKDIVRVHNVILEPVQERHLDLIAETSALYTHRWLDVLEEKFERFEKQTQDSWDEWEASTNCRVLGLWKAAPSDGFIRYFLSARYENLAEWGQSRYWHSDQDGEDQPNWAKLQASRRLCTTDTWVITARLLGTLS